MRRSREALADKAVGVVLLDVILGWGAHPDPAGQLVRALGARAGRWPGHHRLRDRHGGRPAGPLCAGAQAHGGRSRRGALECHRRHTRIAMHRVTSISIWGPHAQRFVERHAVARVAARIPAQPAIWRRTAISSASAIASIGRGPLNAMLARRHGRGCPRACRRSGRARRIAQGMLHIGSIALDATRAEPWRPASWPSAAEARERCAGVATIGAFRCRAGSRRRPCARRAGHWRAIGPRLWSGQRGHACSACGHG